MTKAPKTAPGAAKTPPPPSFRKAEVEERAQAPVQAQAQVRGAGPDDTALLHRVAAETFPLACPPDTPLESIETFISQNLSEAAFAGYLSDPERALFIAEVDGGIAGYAMVVHGDPTDADVLASVSTRPTAELSKLYVRAAFHGARVAAALVEAAVSAANARGARSVWLGVNDQNERANRFYEKNGFVKVGAKTFRLGERLESDFVRERPLR
ncbi:GNAT family N-acetyltransferase [Salinibacterium sp. G-O1]|uniref:GNAT family N-acetyltransferase n=1 Tax=Salinibacterium sp. G-O1 TaxID=3046208 RepID=UPI0024B9A954|nr:GNAT family N-acetyltransferase [Salinibacterium sp. G-O1]MDJ0334297.1 GNAT family N-acetyltransferase [Salinibacterium sp. G-O1]